MTAARRRRGDLVRHMVIADVDGVVVVDQRRCPDVRQRAKGATNADAHIEDALRLGRRLAGEVAGMPGSLRPPGTCTAGVLKGRMGG